MWKRKLNYLETEWSLRHAIVESFLPFICSEKSHFKKCDNNHQVTLTLVTVDRRRRNVITWVYNQEDMQPRLGKQTQEMYIAL